MNKGKRTSEVTTHQLRPPHKLRKKKKQEIKKLKEDSLILTWLLDNVLMEEQLGMTLPGGGRVRDYEPEIASVARERISGGR